MLLTASLPKGPPVHPHCFLPDVPRLRSGGTGRKHKDIDFNQINAFAREVVERPIMTSDKIEALVHNAMANKWVEEGCKLHKKGDACQYRVIFT